MATIIPATLCDLLVNALFTYLTKFDPTVLVSLPSSPRFYLSPRSGMFEFSGPKIGTWIGKRGEVKGKRGKSIYNLVFRSAADCPFPTTLGRNYDGPRKAWKGKIVEYIHDLDLLTLSLLTSKLKDPKSGVGFSLLTRAIDYIHLIGKENFSQWNYYLWNTQGGEIGGRRGVFLIEEGKQRVKIYSPLYTALIPTHLIVNTGTSNDGERSVVADTKIEMISLAKEYKNWKDLLLGRVEGVAFEKLASLFPSLIVLKKSIRYNETWKIGGGMMGSMRTYEPLIDNIIYVQPNLSNIPTKSGP